MGLAGHKPISRIFFHEFQHSGKASAYFLPGLLHGPPPRHINVGMTDTGSHHLLPACHVRIQSLFEILFRLLQGVIEGLGIRAPQIEIVDGPVQYLLDLLSVPVLLLHTGKGTQRHPEIIIQFFYGSVNLTDIHFQSELIVEGSRVGLQIKQPIFSGPGLQIQQHIPVVHVDPLGRLPVHKKQELGILPVIPLINLGADMHPHPLSVQFFRHGEFRAEPIVPVRPVPAHGMRVKRLPPMTVGLRIHRMYEIPFLILKFGDGKFLLHLQLFQFIADSHNPLV